LKPYAASGERDEARDCSAPRRRALFIAAESPYPAVGGGPLRSASLLTFLTQRYDVDVTLFTERHTPDPSSQFPPGQARRISLIPLPHHSKSSLARRSRMARRILTNRPPLIDRFSGFQAEIAAAIGNANYDIALIEHIWCAPYIEQVRPCARRVLLDAHNIESVWHERLANSGGWAQWAAFKRFAHACRKFERKWLPQFDAVMAPSEIDVRRITAARTIVYPNAIPFVPTPSRQERHEVLFTGNLEYQPNITAVRYFYEKIWPLLSRRVPDLIWRIAGKNPGAVTSIVNGDTRVRVIGPMDDAIATLACAKVAVVPLLSGSGTRFKIVEAWASGTPVVSTTIGAEGLRCNAGEHLLLCDDPQEFAEAVAFLIDAPEARAQLGDAGRRLYESTYTWEAAWAALEREFVAIEDSH
jgi:glycosyltransferase involved in cell wall biosynthesis